MVEVIKIIIIIIRKEDIKYLEQCKLRSNFN